MFSLSSSVFLLSVSFSLVLFFLKETMLLFWFMNYVYRISSFCFCHPIARPSFITVYLKVVSTNTTRHNICVSTKYQNQQREGKKKIEEIREMTLSVYKRKQLSKIKILQRKLLMLEVREKQYHSFNRQSNQSFFFCFSH